MTDFACRRFFYGAFYFLLYACNVSPEDRSDARTTIVQAVEVATVKVGLRPFVYQVRAQGSVEAEQEHVLHFRQGGNLSALYHRNGALLRQGELLASLDREERQLSVRVAETVLRERQEELRTRMLEYSPQQQEHASLGGQLSLRTGVDRAQAELDLARLQLQSTELRAPISGRLADVVARPGSRIQPGEAFGRIYAPSSLRVKVAVLEAEARYLRIGQSVSLGSLYAEETYKGRVEQINPSVDAQGQLWVWVKLPAGTDLLPGTHVQVAIDVPKGKALLLPKEAVVLRSGRQVVFIMEQGRAKWKYVSTGLDNGREVEVLEGLKEGDQAIVSNNLQLSHDIPVRLRQP